MQSWQMQNAKARFSELVKHAAQEGPQDITLHGKSVAVVLSRELFDRLSGNEQSLGGFMPAPPPAGPGGGRDHVLSYVVDTNVLSELRNRRVDAKVVAWMQARPRQSLYLCVLQPG